MSKYDSPPIGVFIACFILGLVIGYIISKIENEPVKAIKKDKILIQCKDGSTEWFDLPKCEVKP